jgi:Fic family protein
MIDSMLRQNISTLTPATADPVYIAARFYQRFVYIHPFNDGNGRIARWSIWSISNTGLTLSSSEKQHDG